MNAYKPAKDRFQDDCEHCGYKYNVKRDTVCRNCKKNIQNEANPVEKQTP